MPFIETEVWLRVASEDVDCFGLYRFLRSLFFRKKIFLGYLICYNVGEEYWVKSISIFGMFLLHSHSIQRG